MRKHRPRGPFWGRRETRGHEQPDRAKALAALLTATLRSYEDTLSLHTAEEEAAGVRVGPSAGDCPSCATDLAVLQARARELGLVIDREGAAR